MEDVSQQTIYVSLNIAAQLEQRREGRRKLIRHGGTLCCRCHERPPESAYNRYCSQCRAIYQREWRRRRRDELNELRAKYREDIRNA